MLLTAIKRPEKLVEVDFNGKKVSVLVVAPTVGQRNRIVGDVDQGGKKFIGDAKLGKMQAQACILCCLDPETKQPLFTAQDEEAILETPANGWVDTLFQEVMALLSQEEIGGKKAVGSDGEGPTEPQ
jgi:hypothetical protein